MNKVASEIKKKKKSTGTIIAYLYRHKVIVEEMGN